jgi:K+-sensing histidine kinase KdpD
LKSRDVLYGEQQCTLIVIRDIAELSKIEFARSLEKLTEMMIASTSHDMRTPLNTIITMH